MKFTLILLALSGTAQAATFVSVPKLPSTSITAIISVPTISMPISLPSMPAPSIVPMRFPGVPSPLPLPVPAALNALRRPAPSLGDKFTIDWSFLDKNDGDEAAPALVPVDPGPQPLPPSGALAELRDAIFGREPIRTVVTPAKSPADALFDGRRETAREAALPHGKIL